MVVAAVLLASINAVAQEPARREQSVDYDGYARGRTEGRNQGFIYAALVVAVAAVAFLTWRKFRGDSYLSVRRTPPEGLSTATPEPVPNPPATPSLRAQPPRNKVMFISYRREDAADITGRISDRLIQKFGRDSVFKDVDSIPLGRDFRKHLHDAVSQCDVLLVIIGRNWSEAAATDGKRRLDDPRDHLRIEVEAALQRDIPVIPVLVQGATMPTEDQLPESLRSLAYRHALSVRPDPDFNSDADRLLRGLQAHFDAPR